ncbi:hypothetical protein PQX77_010961 [Marasmius sp. AFHP31]|nr:hypothetical protein PQX77_010961 [Marasmius sp. AFHP31]
MASAAIPSNDDTLSPGSSVKGGLVYLLPNHISLDEGFTMELLAIAVHAVSSLGNFTANQSIVVFGYRLAYLRGGVVVPDVAKQGSETVVEYSNGANMKKVLGTENQRPKSSDLVGDASGAEMRCVSRRRFMLLGRRTRAYIVQLGIDAFFVTLDLSMVLLIELVLRGSFWYGPGNYVLAIALTSQGNMNVKPLITHRYPFTFALEAFKAVQSREKRLVMVDGNQRDGDGDLIRLLNAVLSTPESF